jgi:hypothetical protein
MEAWSPLTRGEREWFEAISREAQEDCGAGSLKMEHAKRASTSAKECYSQQDRGERKRL